MLRYLREHPRLVPLDDQMTLGEVLRTWTLRMHERGFPGHPYVWDEFADYVGVIPVALLAAGILVAVFRRDRQSRQRRIDLVLLAGLIWCALGNIPGPSAFGLLHELPIYTSLRVPSRFLGPAMVGFALVVTSALMAARARLAEVRRAPGWCRRAVRGREIALVMAIAVDVCVTNQRGCSRGWTRRCRARRARRPTSIRTATDYGRFPTHPVRGIGTRQCYVPLDWKPAPGIVDGKVPQQWVEPAAAGESRRRAGHPTPVELDVNLQAPGVVIVNQNYESGWRASTGGDRRIPAAATTNGCGRRSHRWRRRRWAFCRWRCRPGTTGWCCAIARRRWRRDPVHPGRYCVGGLRDPADSRRTPGPLVRRSGGALAGAGRWAAFAVVSASSMAPLSARRRCRWSFRSTTKSRSSRSSTVACARFWTASAGGGRVVGGGVHRRWVQDRSREMLQRAGGARAAL